MHSNYDYPTIRQKTFDRDRAARSAANTGKRPSNILSRHELRRIVAEIIG